MKRIQDFAVKQYFISKVKTTTFFSQKIFPNFIIICFFPELEQ